MEWRLLRPEQPKTPECAGSREFLLCNVPQVKYNFDFSVKKK